MHIQARKKHGDEIMCDTCCETGHYDALCDNKWAFDDNVWFDKVLNRWACFNCYLK